MLYSIYCPNNDTDYTVSEDVKDILIAAGELIDAGTDPLYIIYFWKEGTVSDYYDSVKKGYYEDPDDTYSLESFVRCFGAEGVEVISPEVYHNLTESEQIEALHFIPDEMIIDELFRRFHEYRRTSDKIAEVMDMMKIYV